VISGLVDGRRPVYLCTLPVFVIGSTGVAAAQSIPFLLFWRVIQSMGASLGPILGAAVIGDIFKLEERGRAMGVSSAVTFTFIHPDLMISDDHRSACLEQLWLLLLEVHFIYSLLSSRWVHQAYQQRLTRLDYSLFFMENGARVPRSCWPDLFHGNLLSFPRNQSTGRERY
jgi:hypothetical protein